MIDTGSQPVSLVTESYLEGLRTRGWTRAGHDAALSPDSEVCLTAVPMTDYLGDSERPATPRTSFAVLAARPIRLA